MDAITAEITLRPLRVGFLVSPTDRQVLGKVLALATCMWGGMMCPLIPVSRRMPKTLRDPGAEVTSALQITQGYLRFFEPDVLVETKPGQRALAKIDSNSSFLAYKSIFSLEDLVCSEPGIEPYLQLGVGMHNVYWHLFRQEFQFRKRTKPRILSFVSGDKIANAFFEVCYGMFPTDNSLSHISQSYAQSFDVEVIAPSVEAWEVIERREAGYPLYYTVRDLDQRVPGGWDETIFIFDPLHAGDVIDFWNLRLFVRDVMPVNVHWLEQSRELIAQKIAQSVRPLPRNRNGIKTKTIIQIGRSLNSQQVIDQLNLMNADVTHDSWGVRAWYPRICRENDQGNYSPSGPCPLIAKRQEVQVLTPDEGNSVRLPQLSPDFAETLHRTGPGWVNVVRPHSYGLDKRYASALPSVASTGRQQYLPHSHDNQMPTREGYVTFHRFRHDGVYFNLYPMDVAISGWLEMKGINAEKSDAGRVADQLIRSAGGLIQTVLLAHPELLHQLDNMARSRAVRKDGSSEEYPDRTASITQLQILIRKLKQRPWGSHIELQSYIDMGALRLGIAARCSHCTKENWFSLDDVASEITCERCQNNFPFPQGQWPQRDNWKYRVVGPYATPHYAQGAYSVALTLRYLSVEFGTMPPFTYSTSLLLTDNAGETIETDFFAWHGSEDLLQATGEPSLLIGECKSFGSDVFKADDIARLMGLAERLPGAYLVAATLKDTLSQSDVRALKRLAKWGWRRASKKLPPSRLIILTGTELFAIGPTYNAWVDAGGRLKTTAEELGYIHDFDTLARATQSAYLGISASDFAEI